MTNSTTDFRKKKEREEIEGSGALGSRFRKEERRETEHNVSSGGFWNKR
jgi:hypothetical protein